MRIFNSGRRGFTLGEMIIVLILMSAFSVAATTLFTSIFSITYNAGEAQDMTASVEAALAALRNDVWSAKTIEVSDARVTKLTMPDGRVIAWTIRSGEMIRGDGSEERWRAPGRDPTFTTDGVSLVLKVNEPQLAVGFGEIWMPSQPNLIARLTTP